MAERAVERPGGKVTEVFTDRAERQGAYDFLENDAIHDRDILASIRAATVGRATESPGPTHVIVDGTSVQVVDRARTKDFGGVGSTANGASGLKVVNAYAVDREGVPIGLVDQQWWARGRLKKRRDCLRRPLDAKETRHWVEAIGVASAALRGASVPGWFQVDREGDRFWILHALHRSGQEFTVRSTYGHRWVRVGDSDRLRRLDRVARRGRVRRVQWLAVTGRQHRRARTARLEVRTARVRLDMTESFTGERLDLPVHVVEVREIGTVPRGESPIHWRLLTTHTIETEADVRDVVAGYALRWRVEELHRAWKSAVCRIEDTQLRTAARVTKWATIMVAVAARAERLKNLSRASPKKAASVELSADEIAALLLLKRRERRRTETIPDDVPCLEDAVRWIAELGGYTGKSSGGPPGTVTIRRGLERVTITAAALEALREAGKMR